MTAVALEAALTATDVVVQRGSATLLRGVGCEVRRGEVVAIVGPNGAGKSTLLSVLAGDVRPSAGHATLQGRPVEAWSTVERARLRAVLLQDAIVGFPFTAAEVVAMGRAPWRQRPEAADDDEQIAAAFEATATTHLVDRRVPSLSGGERARVLLARTLAQATPVLLLDEPTAALDLRHQAVVLDVARARADAGTAVVVVLHDLTAAAATADRLVLLHDGRVAADGPPSEVLDERLLGEVYGRAVEVIAHPRTGRPLVFLA